MVLETTTLDVNAHGALVARPKVSVGFIARAPALWNPGKYRMQSGEDAGGVTEGFHTALEFNSSSPRSGGLLFRRPIGRLRVYSDWRTLAEGICFPEGRWQRFTGKHPLTLEILTGI